MEEDVLDQQSIFDRFLEESYIPGRYPKPKRGDIKIIDRDEREGYLKFQDRLHSGQVITEVFLNKEAQIVNSRWRTETITQISSKEQEPNVRMRHQTDQDTHFALEDSGPFGAEITADFEKGQLYNVVLWSMGGEKPFQDGIQFRRFKDGGWRYRFYPLDDTEHSPWSKVEGDKEIKSDDGQFVARIGQDPEQVEKLAFSCTNVSSGFGATVSAQKTINLPHWNELLRGEDRNWRYIRRQIPVSIKHPLPIPRKTQAIQTPQEVG